MIDLIFPLFFLIFFGILGYIILNGLAQWNHNNQQPVLRREARLVTKRSQVSGGGDDSSTSTSYYATFEFEDSGERLELSVKGREFGVMAEGDHGWLTSQGTRFKGFERS
jgi:hypothetical protein